MRVSQGRAYLFKKNGSKDPQEWALIDLGSVSNSDRIKVRGADVKDRLCVIEIGGEKSLGGCVENLQNYNSSIRLRTVEGWKPEIQVEPVYTLDMSIDINISNDSPPTATVTEFSSKSAPSVIVDAPATEGDPHLVYIAGREGRVRCLPNIKQALRINTRSTRPEYLRTARRCIL